MKTIIFSDLDGTLLSKDFSFDEAKEALKRINSEEIPLVFSSSKTKAEMEEIRKKLSNRHPFIAENGGGIFIPSRYFNFSTIGQRLNGYELIKLGRNYSEVRQALIEARSGIDARIWGFGDMTNEEVSKLTGLSVEEAELARRRDFSEPFIFEGGKEAEAELVRRIEEKGFSRVHGSLFHILGPHDKGAAVRILKKFYTTIYGRIITIGIGDGPNDLPLLREVDYPVIVKKPDGTYEEVVWPDLIKAEGIGPAGWNKAVTGILDSIEASHRGYTC
ncbi:MAG: HAD-IIB family hydrolase [Deltaproteobacteria bacterium]|nr:HAD-IIB family hydrolase [Deltaproteobacteria bacterium]